MKIDTRLPGGNGGDGFFRNPILRMESADPAIRRIGNDYYMCYSCYSNQRSLAIWHSRNLVDWEFVTWVLNKQNHQGATAPDFDFYQGRYYVYYQAMNSLFTAWADSVDGPWSDPIDLHIDGIDAAHVVGKDGTRYLHFNAGRMVQLSDDGLSTVGKIRTVFDPWPIPQDFVIEGVCQEAPNLTYRDGFYYLVVAQGGTSGPPTAHMCAMARSETPWGPWEYSPCNPVIRTRFREEKFWQMGHGTLVDTPRGDWYMIFHAYQKDYYTLGRHIMLLPLEWDEKGWCRVKDGIEADSRIPLPFGDQVKHGWVLGDDFSGSEFNPSLEWDLSVPKEAYALKKGMLEMTPFTTSLSETRPLSLLPSHKSYEVETCLKVEKGSVGGLCLGYGWGEKGLKKACAIEFDGKTVRIADHYHIPVEISALWLFLKIVNDRHSVQFYYSTNGEDWIKLVWGYDVSGWHHNSFGGFQLLKPGLYSCGDSKEAKVYARYFKYTPWREIS